MVAHNVQLEILDSYDDLTVNFRGSGSVDGEITLLPGETRSVELAFFAQDAKIKNYDITASLTSTNGTDTVSDLAMIHVKGSVSRDYTVEQIKHRSGINSATYRITNHGQPITDLNISAVDPITDLPAANDHSADLSCACGHRRNLGYSGQYPFIAWIKLQASQARKPQGMRLSTFPNKVQLVIFRIL